MIPIVSFLAALRFLTEAQTCNNGLGKLVFEKMSNHVINYTHLTSKEIFTSVDAPIKVLEECFRRCRQNELSPNSIDQYCVAFDLIAGERRSSPFQSPSTTTNNHQITAHYEESKCILHTLNANGFSPNDQSTSRHDSSKQDIMNSSGGTLNQNGAVNGDLNNEASNSISALHSVALVNSEQHISNSLVKHQNGWHFSPQCIKNRLINDCHRTYSFDRTAKHKLINVDIEFNTTSRLDCEERCLENVNLPCRSISYDTVTMKCGLSNETRQSRPDIYKMDSNFEYIENLCLPKKQLCNFISFIAQRNKEMKGIFERELTVATDLFECAMLCVNALDEKGYFCRTFSYDQTGQTCILYDESSDIEIVENLESITKLSHGNLFTVQCLNDKDDEIWNNSLLELHHKKRLSSPQEVEMMANSPLQCMQQCSKRFAYNCKMFEFSMKEKLCRFSSEYTHQRRMISGTPHLTFDNLYDFYNVISVQSTNDILYQQSPQYMMNHNNIYGNNGNMLNDLNYQIDPSLQFQQAATTMFKSHNNLLNTQPRNGLQHFNQFLQLNNRNGFGYERHSMLNNNHQPNYLQTNNVGSRHFNSLITDLSNQHGYINNHQTPAIQQRQSGLTYPSNYNGQNSLSNHQKIVSNVHASSSQVSPSIQAPGGGLTGKNAPSNTASSNSNLLSVSTNNHFNQIYPNNLMVSAANSPSPAYGIPYHSPISSNVISLNTPINSVQSNSINISPNPSIHQSQNPPPTQLNNNGMNSFGGSGGINSCKYPLSSSMSGNLNGLEALSSNAAGSLLSDKFTKKGLNTRLIASQIHKILLANKLEDCEKACIESKAFVCKSFNYRENFQAENCELSMYDSSVLKLGSPQFFEQSANYNFYERDISPLAGNLNAMNLMALSSNNNPNFASECVEVSQSCSPEGMEFTLRTSDKFYGRIYTYGFYDSCYFDGNGGNVNVLKISRPNGFPRCGSIQFSDAMTNIVVVQFNDYVQTSRDRKYNLTCYFSGPGEAVITSNYLDTKTDPRHPMQIESLPPQNILTSNVVLRVLYRGSPVDFIGVGDLLTFRLETKSQYRYDLYNNDIFATNVIAKDPYTGRQVQLIDSKGCPSDTYVFPELHKTPDGALESEFYAFRLPDSSFLVFQATVRTCRGPCEPVICSDSARSQSSFPSWGRRRRRRDVDELEAVESSDHHTIINEREAIPANVNDDKEKVYQLYRVYSSRSEIPKAEALKERRLYNDDEFDNQKPVKDKIKNEKQLNNINTTVIKRINEVCVTQVHYYSLLVILILLLIWLILAGAYFIVYLRRRHKKITSLKNLVQSRNQLNQLNQLNKSTLNNLKTNRKTNIKSQDAIYSDITMQERSVSEMQYGNVLMNIY